MKPANSSGWERFATSPNSLNGPHAAVEHSNLLRCMSPVVAKRTCRSPHRMSAFGVPAQRVDATQALIFSAGVSNCKVSRGRSLSGRATLFRWACECTDKSVPFGKYCLSRPLVFSFDPRCHGLCGSQKYTYSTATAPRSLNVDICVSPLQVMSLRLSEE